LLKEEKAVVSIRMYFKYEVHFKLTTAFFVAERNEIS